MPDVSRTDKPSKAAHDSMGASRKAAAYDGAGVPRNEVTQGKGEKNFNEAASILEGSALSPYADIINLSRPKSLRPAMPLRDRAAQFSPFAALTGYEAAIGEAAREVQAYINELDRGIPIELEEL